jgi:uncharacterized membrane protein
MNDHRLELIIGQLLRTGVLLAAAMVLAGGILYLVQHHDDRVSYRAFSSSPQSTRTLRGIVRSASKGQSAAIIQIGLVLLIFTPIARVAIAMVGFSLEHDHLYTVVSLIVLVILVFSVIRAT